MESYPGTTALDKADEARRDALLPLDSGAGPGHGRRVRCPRVPAVDTARAPRSDPVGPDAIARLTRACGTEMTSEWCRAPRSRTGPGQSESRCAASGATTAVAGQPGGLL